MLAASILALVMTAGCTPVDAGVQSSPLALDLERPDRDRVGKLLFRGAIELRAQDDGFGGLSGLTVSPDGRRMVSVSDRGAVVTAALDYDGAGRLAAARDVAVRPLPDRDGAPVAGGRRDAEALTRLPDGRWAVSFERRHRVQVYAASPGGPTGKGAVLLGLTGLETASANQGIEALAALPDGRLLAIEEGPGDAGNRHRAWIGGAGGWKDLTYVAKEPYLPTDAAALPGGDLLVLERRASLIGGFGARVMRVPGRDIVPGAVLEGEELAELEAPVLVDNYEGIAAVPAPGGGTHVYVVSDDNFFPLQRNVLLMFRLD
jgi:hypothetical protein